MILLLIPLVVVMVVGLCGAICARFVKRSPFEAATLAVWAALTTLILAPGGILAAQHLVSRENPGGFLVLAVSLSGFVASALMVHRISRLYRGEALGNSTYLIAHHGSVLLAFVIADAWNGGFYLGPALLFPCAVGALLGSKYAAIGGKHKHKHKKSTPLR